MDKNCENYDPCRGCDEYKLNKKINVINPFIWPYSGVNNIDSYILNKEISADGEKGPLTHSSTTDHVVLTN